MRLRWFALIAVATSSLWLLVTLTQQHVGQRIFLRNDSRCEILVAEQHDSHLVKPGDRVLVKSIASSGIRKLVIAKAHVWPVTVFSEYSVSTGRAPGEERVNISVPREWWSKSTLGEELVFAVNDAEVLALVQPVGTHPPLDQPPGLPLPGLPTSRIPVQSELTCG
jgi:hypothetical protein